MNSAQFCSPTWLVLMAADCCKPALKVETGVFLHTAEDVGVGWLPGCCALSISVCLLLLFLLFFFFLFFCSVRGAESLHSLSLQCLLRQAFLLLRFLRLLFPFKITVALSNTTKAFFWIEPFSPLLRLLCGLIGDNTLSCCGQNCPSTLNVMVSVRAV